VPLVPLFSRHRSVSVVHVVPLYNKFDCLLLNVILQRLSRSLSESVQCHSSDDNGNNEFTITRHTHFTSRNSKSNPFPFLLRLAGAKRLVDGRNNHGFLHDDLAVVFLQCAFISQRNRYARASPLHQHLVLSSNDATKNTSITLPAGAMSASIQQLSRCTKTSSIPNLKR